MAAPASGPTALDRYVAAPDPGYRFSVVATRPGEGHTAYLIDLVSQRWLTTADPSPGYPPRKIARIVARS